MQFKHNILLITVLFTICLSAGFVSAQTEKLTKDELVEKSNALYEAGQRREALALIDKYPEFADEVDVLYVKSVALVELRDYKNADVAFQRQFDIFLRNADEAIKIAEDYVSDSSKEDKELGEFMYSTALISFASADLINSLRTVAMEKNGMPREKLAPKNLTGFDEFRKKYVLTAVKTGELDLELNKLNEAVDRFSRAIELDQKTVAAYAGRAKTYRKQKKITLARADERKIVQLGKAR